MTTPLTVSPFVALNPVDNLPVTSEASAVFPSTNKEIRITGNDIFNMFFFMVLNEL
jgi:hypothetical protein